MIAIHDVIIASASRSTLEAIEWFLILFPGISAILSIAWSREYTRESHVHADLRFDSHDVETAHTRWPVLTVIIPAHNEQAHIETTLASVCSIQWPTLHVVVVDDGSTDGTAEVVRAHRPAVTLISKPVNEGKSRALNDAITSTPDGLVMIVDADCIVPATTANLMARHFVKNDDIAAVTSNPRVTETKTLIEKLQAIEFCATVSTARRGQAVWGRILTMSGICTLLRREALSDVGLFDDTQPTEDIEMTWRLNLSGWRVTYEPEAVVGMEVPATLRPLIVQRRRWARGLVRVLRTHWWRALRTPRQWPILAESVLSILWCHLILIVTVVLVVARLAGVHESSPALSSWGIALLLLCAIQVVWGMRLDARHDSSIWSVLPWIPMYAVAYWVLSSIVVTTTTLPALFSRSTSHVVWGSDRSTVTPSTPTLPEAAQH